MFPNISCEERIEVTGRVRWFDGMAGEGQARIDGLEPSVYLHFASILGVNLVATRNDGSTYNNYYYPSEADQVWLDGISGRPFRAILTRYGLVEVELLPIDSENA